MANSSTISAVSIGGAVLFCQSANVTVSRTVLPVTSLGDEWEFNRYGVARVTGSVEVLYDVSDHGTIVNALENATGTLAVTITWATGESWSGNAFVTEVNASVAVDDLVKASITFNGSGQWTV